MSFHCVPPSFNSTTYFLRFCFKSRILLGQRERVKILNIGLCPRDLTSKVIELESDLFHRHAVGTSWVPENTSAAEQMALFGI